MRTLLTKFVDIRDGETSRAMLMFSYIFLIICCLLIIKPVRNSLFLERFGAAQLPYAFILVAAIAGIVSTIYSRYASRVRLDLLIRASTAIILSNLLLFWTMLYFDYEGGWFIYAFYVWSAIFGAITTSQFWILANYVFDAREAKRLFGFIGAGAISGGIFGGYLTSFLAPIIGTENLLFLCIAFLMVCMFILQLVWKQRATGGKSETSKQRHQARSSSAGSNALKLLLSSKHTAYLAGIVAVSVTIANLVDFQYNDIIDKSITNPDEVTAFLGLWLSNLSLISLAVQLFLTNRILKTLGVGATLFFLPIGILVGAVAILFNPTLWSAISVKIADGSLKQSINKAGLELLYLPVPSSIKPQIKAFIDVFVDSLSTGLSGVLLIVCTAVFGFQVGEISIITIALIGLWIFLIIRIRAEYTQAFRMAIEKRTINLAEQDVNLDDASMFKNLLEILSGDNKKQILYVLDLLDNVTHPSFVPHLRRLLKHDDAEIREKALKLTMQYATDDFSEDVQPMLKAENQQLRTLALDYLFKRSDDKVEFLQKYIEHEDYHLRAAALLCLSSSKGQLQGLDDQAIESRIKMLLERLENESSDDAEQKFMKSHIAQAIGLAKIPELNPYLHKLFNDELPEVVAAAARSAGNTKAPEFIEILIDLLDRKQVKQHARESLAAYGEQAIPNLIETLNTIETRIGVRLVIPRVISMVGTQNSVDVLTDQLGKSDLILRDQIIKSLTYIRREFPLLKFNDTAIEKFILRECQNYIQMLNVLNAQHNLGLERVKSGNGRQEAINNARALLIKALEEKLDNNLERVFRLLGLRYEQKDMLNAYLGIVSDKQDLRANAVEFLDNILDISLKRFIIPIVENASLSQLIEVARSQLNITVVDESQCLRELLGQSDAWLQACTVFLIGQLQDVGHKADVEAMHARNNSVLSEAIDFTMKQLRSAENE